MRHDPNNPDCQYSTDPGVASPDSDFCTCPQPELDQARFDQDRSAILAQAVGIARQQLRDGQPERALATLDSAVEATLQLHREALISIGLPEDMVDSCLGLAR